MALCFAFINVDVCGLICGALPVVLVSIACVCRFIRWWNMQPTSRCPRCRAVPPVLDIYNFCWKCGCEYDKWGCILKDAVRPPLDDLDLARFSPRQNPSQRGEGLQEFKTDGEVRE